MLHFAAEQPAKTTAAGLAVAIAEVLAEATAGAPAVAIAGQPCEAAARELDDHCSGAGEVSAHPGLHGGHISPGWHCRTSPFFFLTDSINGHQLVCSSWHTSDNVVQ